MADGRSQTDLTMPDLFTFWFTSRKASPLSWETFNL
jgi:hypothetical protein